jgi:hypothetical protein
MKNNFVYGITLSFATALLCQPEASAQLKPTIQSSNLSRFKVVARPAYGAYFSKLSAIAKKPTASGTQTLVSKTGSLGKSEVVVNMVASNAPVRTVGSPSTRRNGSSLCETQNYILDYLNAGIFNTYESNIPNTIFPGAFVDGLTLLNKRPGVYTADNRSPLNISISINDRQDIKSYNATSFGSNYEDELQASLRNASFGTRIPAYLVMNTVEVNSTTDLQANLNLTVGLMIPLEELGLPVEISQGLSGGIADTSSRIVHTYVITYEQPMYDYSVKENDRNLFFTAAGAAARHPNAVLVRSVIYGRRITMLVRSVEDAETVSTTIRERLGLNVTGGDLAGFTAGARIDAAVINRFSQHIKSFKATVQGGNSSLGNRVFSDPAAIKDYIEDPNAAVLKASTGEVPIQYVLEKVNTDALVGIRSTANYSAQNCIQPTYTVEVLYKGIKCHKVVEAPFDDKEDIFGTCSANGKVLVSIPEGSATSLATNATSADIKTVKIDNNIPLNNMSDYIVSFDSRLKDWEALQKPEFKLAQPLDGKYQINTTRLNKILDLQKGESTLLEQDTQSTRLYENGDRSAASIAVLYQVRVTRN